MLQTVLLRAGTSLTIGTVLAIAGLSVSAQTPDQLLKDAFKQINTGVNKNDDATVLAGLDLLRKFAHQAPETHRLKNSAASTLAFLDQMREAEKQLAQEAEKTANLNKTVVKSGVISGRVLVLPRPSKMPLAKEAKAHGQVSVRVEVGEDGKVERIISITGHPLLQESAAEAALNTRFAPTKLNGVSIKIQGNLVYNFD